MNKNDSHIPNDKTKHETAPLPQGHRRALGLPADGMSNPNGADCGPRDNKIANGGGKTY